jgi:hypothetical protein
MRLLMLDFPNSWYNISEKKEKNYFHIKTHPRETTENKFTEEKLWKITVPDGVWSNFEIVHYLNTTYFNTADEFSELSYIRFFLDTKTLLTTIERVDGTPIDFKFDLILSNGNRPYSSLGWMLGFRNSEYLNIIQNITSESIYDGIGTKYVYVAIEDYNSYKDPDDVIYMDERIIDKNILGKVYTDGRWEMILDDENNSSNLKIRFYYGPVNINKIKVCFYDDNGNFIDFNNMDLSFSLKFVLAKKNKF